MTKFLKGNDPVADRRKINRWIEQLNICKKDPEHYGLSNEQLSRFETNMRSIAKQYRQIYGGRS